MVQLQKYHYNVILGHRLNGKNNNLNNSPIRLVGCTSKLCTKKEIFNDNNSLEANCVSFVAKLLDYFRKCSLIAICLKLVAFDFSIMLPRFIWHL